MGRKKGVSHKYNYTPEFKQKLDARLMELSQDGQMISRNKWDESRGEEFPSGLAICKHYGLSWSEYAASLGLVTSTRGRKGGGLSFDHVESRLIELSESGVMISQRGWDAVRGDMPSSTSIREYFALTWNELAEALSLTPRQNISQDVPEPSKHKIDCTVTGVFSVWEACIRRAKLDLRNPQYRKEASGFIEYAAELFAPSNGIVDRYHREVRQ